MIVDQLMKKILLTFWLSIACHAAFGDTLASALEESKFDWKNFQPNVEPQIPILANETKKFSDAEIQKQTEKYQTAQDDDTRKWALNRIDHLKQLEYSQLKREVESEKDEVNELLTFLLEKYNAQHGNDFKFEIGIFETFTPYKVFSDFELNRCKSEFDQLIAILGDPSTTRDLSSPFDTVPQFTIGSQKLEAAWELAGFHIEFDCSAMVNFQNFKLTANITWDNLDRNKRVQTALNFFGFNVGSVDGKIGNKTLQAIADFNSCIGSVEAPILDQKRYEFLINTYETLINKKFKANCSSLVLAIPRQFMSYIADLRFLSPDRSSNIQPITWLQCLENTLRYELFKYDSDETKTTNEIRIFGIDFASNNVFAENKNLLSENAKVSTGTIFWEENRELDGEQYDSIKKVTTIDRMTGQITQKAEIFKNSKLLARLSGQGECSKVEVAKQ
ncbi:MAG: hypothetical protein CL525_00395, partial [Aequorivita sp.]|nr:hypothetical protein [Aequorivita sp.]